MTFIGGERLRIGQWLLLALSVLAFGAFPIYCSWNERRAERGTVTVALKFDRDGSWNSFGSLKVITRH